MTVQLYGGRLDAFADSMADEMEKALNAVRSEAGLDALPAGDRDRRMLFIAIARGVITHLQTKEQAFEITYQDGGVNRKTFPDIQVK